MKIYRILFVLLFISIFLPSLVFASWWNPFSWFKKSSTIVQTSTSTIITTSSSSSEQIKKPQEQVE